MYSMLAFWVGGAGSPTITQAGYRGMLAPWIGGASNPVPVGTQGGFRSMIAFWGGGGGSGPTPGGQEIEYIVTFRRRRR